MNRPYTMSEEDFYKLESVRDSIDLVQMLSGEVTRPHSVSPQLYSSFLDLMKDEISTLIQSAKTELSMR